MKKLSEMKSLSTIFDDGGRKYANEYPNAVEKLKTHYQYDKHDRNNLSKIYTSESYGINNSLWKGKKHPRVSIMDDIMSRHKTPKAMVVYSGSGNDPRHHMDEHGIVNHLAYLSTSLNHNTAMGFATGQQRFVNGDTHTHLYRIKIPKDHPTIFDNEHEEQEVILPRNTKLKHIRTESRTTESAYGNKKFHEHLHHMEVVK